MKRISSNIVGISIIALAMSTLIVGLAWAGSSALRGSDVNLSVTDTTVPSDDSVPNDDGDIEIDPDSPLDNSELTQLVIALSEQVDELSGVVNDGLDDLDAAVKRINGLASGIDEAQSDAASALSQAKKASTTAENAASKIDGLATTLDEVTTKVDDVTTKVTAVESKLVKINSEGIYTGTITPGQLSRKLTALDMSGDWPLDRTSGDLEAAKLKGPTFGCSNDYRFNTFAAFDVWSRITCVRVPK